MINIWKMFDKKASANCFAILMEHLYFIIWHTALIYGSYYRPEYGSKLSHSYYKIISKEENIKRKRILSSGISFGEMKLIISYFTNIDRFHDNCKLGAKAKGTY